MEPPDFAKRILNFNRLLEGENRDSYEPDDVRHWRAVYTARQWRTSSGS